MFSQSITFKIKPLPATMISNTRRNQIDHIQWPQNPPSLVMAAARSGAAKTHISWHWSLGHLGGDS